jgi:predicted ArsR family transcriptional regulator
VTALRQLSLYEAQLIPAPYQSSSETSAAAAYSVREHITPRQQMILDYLEEHGPSTQDEISEGLGLRIQSVNPRVHELAMAGVVVDTGRLRATSSGRNAVVWDLPGTESSS